jgi:hypothetical protein
MGAGIVCFQQPGRNLVVRVRREEEGVSSLRPELSVIARTLQATSLEADLLYLCDSEAVLNKVSRSIDRPFIVLAETKPSKRHIPVWARYSPLRTRVEAHANTLSP